MGLLDGKVALITGGARGQGATEARLFVSEGARVVVADVLDDEGKAVAAELGDAAIYQHLDVTNAEDWTAAVAATVDAFGALHILINNAGILRMIPIEEMSLDEYMQVININQVGTWIGMKTAMPAIRDAGGGAIVNISSTAGLRGVRGCSAYVSSKWAVRGMTKVAALEFGQYGIRVNSVHPGVISTPMTGIAEDAGGGPWEAYAIPRVGTVDDVAQMVLFLASEKSSYSSGSEFVVDGGSTAGY